MKNKFSGSKQWPFWLITIAAFIALPGFTLIQDGMFCDAMLYTSVAHNQANGMGTFWFPYFSETNLGLEGIKGFHEQPPLVFWMVSLFFRAFGDSMYVERLYIFFTSCITANLIVLLWREVFKKNEAYKKLSWLPLFFWITTPTVFWGCSNNMNENTMGIFTLAAVVLSYKALNGYRQNMVRWLLVGLFIFLATLSKGFPGLFPLCVPLMYWLAARKITLGKTLLYTLIPLAVISVLYFALYLYPTSRESLSIYLFKRAFHRIASDPTTSFRFASLVALLKDVIIQLCSLIVVFIIAYYRKLKMLDYGKTAILFISIGLCGSMPLMLTMVQKAFYLLPSFPYIAIGTSILIAPFAHYCIQKIELRQTGFKFFKALSIFLFLSSFVVVAAMKGKTSREEDMLHDVYTIGKIVPKHTTVVVSHSFSYMDWGLEPYLMRHFYISVAYKQSSSQYLLVDSANPGDLDLTAYSKVEGDWQRYILYERR